MKNRLWYSAFFRVAIAVLLLLDVFTSFPLASDIYNLTGYEHANDLSFPFFSVLRENIQIFLSVYVFFLILFLLGIGRNLTSVIIFILYNIDFLLIYPGVFWGDYVLRTTLLYFVFVDSFQYLALNIRKKDSEILSRLAVLSIMLNVCLVYVSNAYFKLHNSEWLDGTAIAYFFKFSEVLDLNKVGSLFGGNEFFIKISTWMVLIFQIIFPLMIWFKRTKYPWILIGILIHLFMAVTLQLYKFELIIILLYGFFISDNEWRNIFRKINYKI